MCVCVCEWASLSVRLCVCVRSCASLRRRKKNEARPFTFAFTFTMTEKVYSATSGCGLAHRKAASKAPMADQAPLEIIVVQCNLECRRRGRCAAAMPKQQTNTHTHQRTNKRRSDSSRSGSRRWQRQLALVRAPPAQQTSASQPALQTLARCQLSCCVVQSPLKSSSYIRFIPPPPSSSSSSE